MALNSSISRRVFQNSSVSFLAANLFCNASVFNSISPALIAAEPRKKRIPIAQIGTSHGHATKISVYRKSDDYEVVGVVEANPARRKQVQDLPAFRGLTWLTIEQVLNDTSVEAVLIESDVRNSLAIAEKCIRADKHIHLDKPAGESLQYLSEILDLAKQRERFVQMGYMYRFNPGWLLLKQLHSKGYLGEIFEVHAVMSKVIGTEDRKSLATYPGGTMFELGCHLIDLLVDLLGQPTKINSFPSHSGSHPDTLADNMLAVFEYPKALASIKSSALEVEGFARRHFTVCGTQGTFHIQPLDQPKVILSLDQAREGYAKGTQEISFPNPFERYVADAAEMAQVLRNEITPRYSYEHDLAVQRAVLLASNLTTDN
jgi:predicted dehydrogenase